MPARTGQEYIDAIGAKAITVEIHGECTTGRVTEIPAFRNVIRSYAALYDMQQRILTEPGSSKGFDLDSFLAKLESAR
jgi:4-hydroxyphenylacetate 3-monooxygenase